MGPPRDLSAEDVDWLLAADQHCAAALELAQPFFEPGDLAAARQIAHEIAIRVRQRALHIVDHIQVVHLTP